MAKKLEEKPFPVHYQTVADFVQGLTAVLTIKLEADFNRTYKHHPEDLLLAATTVLEVMEATSGAFYLVPRGHL